MVLTRRVPRSRSRSGARSRPRGLAVPVLGRALDEDGEHLVEGRPILAGADHLGGSADGLDDIGRPGAGVVDDDGQRARTVLADAADERQRPQLPAVERRLGLDDDHVAAHRLAAELLGGGQGDQSPARDHGHLVA